MPIPSEIRDVAESALGDFCRHHSSAAIADRLRYRYEFGENFALLIEERPGFMNPAEWSSKPVAKFRFSVSKGDWSLYWCDSNDRWRRLSSAPASKDIRKLLQMVSDDPTGVFWG